MIAINSNRSAAAWNDAVSCCVAWRSAAQLDQRLTQLARQQQQLLSWKRQQKEISEVLSSIRAPDPEALVMLQKQTRQLEALAIRSDAMASVITLECSDQQVPR